jgi:hypothetical protein
MIRRSFHYLGALGLLFSLAVAVVVACQRYLPGSPFPASTQALKVSGVTLAYATAVLVLARWWRGRLLLALVGLATVAGISLTASLTGSWPAVLTTLWLVSLAAAAGDWLLKRFAPGLVTIGIEHLLVAMTLGLGGFMALVALLGAAGLLYPWLAWGIMALLTLLLAPWAVGRLRGNWHLVQAGWKNADLRLLSLTLAAAGLCLLGAYLWALAPNIRYDALNYHLGVPAQYVANHAIVPVPETFNSTLVHYAEMLYMLALLLVGQPMPNLILLSFSLVAAGWAFAIGYRLKGPLLGLLAVFFYLSLPTVTLESSTGYVDVILATFVGGSLLAGLAWWQSGQLVYLVCMGIFGGFALGIKTTAVMLLLPEVGLLLAALLYRRRLSIRLLCDLAIFGLPFVLLPLPWILRDWAWTGNPVFPLLDSLFHTTIKVPAEVVTSTSLVAGYAPGFSLLQFIRLPWDLSANGALFYREGAHVPEGMVASLPLLALPWVYGLAPRFPRPVKILAFLGVVLAGLAVAISFSMLKSIRLLQPVFPLLAVLGAANLTAWWEEISSPRLRRVFLFLGVPLLAVYLVATRMVFGAFSGGSEAYPLQYVLGRESRAQFLSRNLGVYDALQVLNQEASPGTKVLSLGNEFRLYTQAHIFGPMFSTEAFQVLHEPATPDSLSQALRQQNYSYLLVYPPEQQYRSIVYEAPALNPQFYRQFTCLVTIQGYAQLYRLVDSPRVCPNGLSDNLLVNPGFEDVLQGIPAGWLPTGKPQLDPAVTFDGHVSAQINGSSSLYQDLAVVPGKTYALAYWSKATLDDQVVQNYVHWLDRDKNPISVSAEWNTQTSNWQRFDFPMVAPPQAAYARVTVSVVAGDEAWVDDVCFALGPACP